ncbi:MAG: phosphocholine cytidylyltransferase family protein [Candidatus Margulisiibacteriota bacterium]|jgi:choline kinase
MKAIILAAGQGTRLKHLTENKPKCMVELFEKPLINYLLDVLKSSKVKEIAIVGGYKNEVLFDYLKDEKLRFFMNQEYAVTNMVYTLFEAKSFFDDDLIITYSDIIYTKDVLTKLIASNADISVVVDKRWEKLWELRMEDPLKDAETMKINAEHNILELGKKPENMNDIQGQYIGLIKISKNILNKVVSYYDNLDRDQIYDGKNFNNMFMTSFINLIINQLTSVKAVYINNEWLEVDSLEDIACYRKNKEYLINELNLRIVNSEGAL